MKNYMIAIFEKKSRKSLEVELFAVSLLRYQSLGSL